MADRDRCTNPDCRLQLKGDVPHRHTAQRARGAKTYGVRLTKDGQVVLERDRLYIDRAETLAASLRLQHGPSAVVEILAPPLPPPRVTSDWHPDEEYRAIDRAHVRNHRGKK